MTRRERLERKAERRREWADGRRSKGNALLARGDKYRGDVAFNTQPGHIPERARIIAATDRGFENLKVADYHDGKADGLERALERSIFSDDADAVQQLEARITELTAQADRNTAINKAYRKAPGADPAAKLTHLVATGVLTRAEALGIAEELARCHWEKQAIPAYRNANLRKRIATDKERIVTIKARTARTETAEAAGGVSIVDLGAAGDGTAYTRVTFTERPERAVIDALKAAGYWWGGGSWTGATDKLPEIVRTAAEYARVFGRKEADHAGSG